MHFRPSIFTFAGAGISLVLLALGAAGCISVKTAPIEVKPVHITVDVNVRVDKALDDFFDDIDKKSTTVNAPSEETKK
ncbi:MAG TPA: hypothetical protein VHD32_01845 [Candidatus Didemnitutus sp.]|nr:hypothetical protein [Candidatus Didemnitutus sp.]